VTSADFMFRSASVRATSSFDASVAGDVRPEETWEDGRNADLAFPEDPAGIEPRRTGKALGSLGGSPAGDAERADTGGFISGGGNGDGIRGVSGVNGLATGSEADSTEIPAFNSSLRVDGAFPPSVGAEDGSTDLETLLSSRFCSRSRDSASSLTCSIVFISVSSVSGLGTDVSAFRAFSRPCVCRS
jgi:hypothetical protein